LSNGLVYAMGIDPGVTTGIGIIGVHERTIYRDYPGRISYFESFSVTGNFTSQVITIMQVAAEFYPLALICESFTSKKVISTQEYLSPVKVGARIEMCAETHYTLAPFFWQSPELALATATDERLKLWGLYEPGPDHPKDGTRHAITFIRRAKQDTDLRDKAWGPPPDHRVQRRGSGRSRVRV
jgi:hypothetical protein